MRLSFCFNSKIYVFWLKSKEKDNQSCQKRILEGKKGKILKALDKSEEAWYDITINVDGNK